MTTSSPEHSEAIVWSWPPGATEPVPTGVLEMSPSGGSVLTFAYATTYLNEGSSPPLFLPELPKKRGRQEPAAGLDVHGVIRDGGPDSWGQRVILRRLLGRETRNEDPGKISLLTYLLESGSNRPGALDFQRSRDTYVPRNHAATLEDLMEAADRLQTGETISEHLQEALAAGSSAGGARPKATVADGDRDLIAKFTAQTDTYPVMKAEAVAMELARRVGLDVARTELVEIQNRPILLVERFDRGPGGTRRQFASALTILGLSEIAGRYATYHEFADVIRTRFPERRATLTELFARIVFNVLVSNTDDHARNHAAFWNGDDLELTPAYDICPQPRAGQTQAQAMEIGPHHRSSQVATCLEHAKIYELNNADAKAIIDCQIETITAEWSDAADVARLTTAERRAMWGHQILNPYATHGYQAG
ncbi:type II toxin-antitoxin system HipA family toxin [soil metagenome]